MWDDLQLSSKAQCQGLAPQPESFDGLHMHMVLCLLLFFFDGFELKLCYAPPLLFWLHQDQKEQISYMLSLYTTIDKTQLNIKVYPSNIGCVTIDDKNYRDKWYLWYWLCDWNLYRTIPSKS